MRLLIADRFAVEGLQLLRDAQLEISDRPAITRAELLETIPAQHALIVRSQTQVDAELLDRAHQLLIVGRAGVGCENIDLAACDRLGIAVINTPGASAVTTAERTIALMLALLHQIPAADRSVRDGKWDRRSFLVNEAFDKTLGVLGYGNVGRVVVDRALGLRMRVLVHDPNVVPESAFNVGARAVGFDQLFEESDIISCHVSADPALRGLVGERELARMRRGSFMINTSRGFVVDERALARALESGHLRGAALDVFENEPLPETSPLRSAKNVIFSPHLGASSAEAERRVSCSVAAEVARFLRTGTASALLNQSRKLRRSRVDGDRSS